MTDFPFSGTEEEPLESPLGSQDEAPIAPELDAAAAAGDDAGHPTAEEPSPEEPSGEEPRAEESSGEEASAEEDPSAGAGELAGSEASFGDEALALISAEDLGAAHARTGDDARAEQAEGEAAEPEGAQSASPERETGAEPEDDGTSVAPAVPAAFGLLFQAPQVPAPRRASRPAGAATPPSAPAQEEEAAHAPEQEAPDQGENQESPKAEEPDSTGGESSARSRRRRGGKGPRGRDGLTPTEAEGTTGADDTPAKATSGTDGAERVDAGGETAAEPVQDGADENDGDDNSARRRRRRRRTGSSGANDDPPGTVTKVREARNDRDQVASVKGSTRLEAKKQRRREGREAGRRRTIITEKEFLARRESVERVMVVRRTQGRTQIGVLEDGILVEHYVSRTTNASMAGNIYLGRVQNVLPSMEAAFVDIGRGRNAVLYAGEVNWDVAGLESGEAKRIENVLTSGESVLVQVTKDPIGHKGARLTSQISLPGRYLVYVPQGSMTGISRKLPDTERSRLKAILKEIVPADAGVIVRTAAEGASEEELRRDVERLAKTWEKVSKAAAGKAGKKGNAPMLLNSEPDLTVRVIRDVFNEDFASLVVAGDEVWEEISGYVEDVAPDLASRMTKWTGEQDVFAAHRIDEQLAKGLDRKVYLPSGGSLVIDRTEAMTVIDVNTGKFVGSGGNLEETVTKNNLEAAEEIVRQLRLRDVGGIIVIDFIDMVLESNRDLVVRRLLECLGRDRTKHQVAEVTSLGLVQMTRKRVASGLLEVFSESCEHCSGRGVIVRNHPVDGPDAETSSGGGSNGNGAHSHGGNGGQGSGGNGRGRRGRGGQSEPAKQAAAAPARSGPTAAQIAAAAHAAAVKQNGDSDPQQTGDSEPLPAIPEPGAELADLLTEDAAPVTAPADVEPAGATTGIEASTAGEPAAAEPAAAGETQDVASAGDSTPHEPGVAAGTDPQAPRRARRKRGRATAPAGPPRAAANDAEASGAGRGAPAAQPE